MDLRPLKGIVASVFTPFKGNTVNYSAISQMATDLFEQNVFCIGINGTSGESYSLTIQERKEILTAWMKTKEVLQKKINVMVEIGAHNLPDTIELCKDAVQQRAQSVALMCPTSYKPQNCDELAKLIIEIAKITPNTPLYFHHDPFRSEIDYAICDALIQCRKKCPNFIGVKFTHSDMLDLSAIINEGFSVLMGGEHLMISGMAIGCDGVVGSTVNFAGKTYYQILRAIENKEWEKARKLNFKASQILDFCTKYGFLTTSKNLYRIWRGIDIGQMRWPSCNLEGEELKQMTEEAIILKKSNVKDIQKLSGHEINKNKQNSNFSGTSGGNSDTSSELGREQGGGRQFSIESHMKTFFTLPRKQIDLMIQSAPSFGENSIKVFDAFYDLLFKHNPETIAKFNKSNLRTGKQQQAMAHALMFYASNIENFGRLGGAIEKMTNRHAALSLPLNLYPVVHRNLMKALNQVLGSIWTPETFEAWNQAILQLTGICMETDRKYKDKCAARRGGWKSERQFKINKKTQIAKNVYQFEFAPTDGYSGGFEFTPGQYLTIRLPNKDTPRHYTITSELNSIHLSCAIKLESGGAVSTHMHNQMYEGDTLFLGVPAGIFIPKIGTAVLISAGMGTTPMVQFLRHYGREKTVCVFQVFKNQDQHIFRQEFLDSGVDCQFRYTEKQGRPDIGSEMEQLVNKAGSDAHYYICGPDEFMTSVIKSLKVWGVNNTHYEMYNTGNIKV